MCLTAPSLHYITAVAVSKHVKVAQWFSAFTAISHAAYKNLGLSPTYNQWSFSAVIRFLHSTIKPNIHAMWYDMKNIISVMMLHYHNK